MDDSTLLSKITRLQIPRHTRQPDHQPIHALTHLNLTPQSTRLRQPKCQIQHVVLVVIRLLHLVVHVRVVDNHMASRARAGPSARPFHLEIVGLRNVEQVVAIGDFEGVRVAFFVDEGYVPLLAGFGGIDVAVRTCGGCGEGAAEKGGAES